MPCRAFPYFTANLAAHATLEPTGISEQETGRIRARGLTTLEFYNDLAFVLRHVDANSVCKVSIKLLGDWEVLSVNGNAKLLCHETGFAAVHTPNAAINFATLSRVTNSLP